MPELIKKLLGLDFASQHARIKNKYATHHFNKRSQAALKGWQTRRNTKCQDQ